MGKWEMVKLGDVGDIITGNTPSTKYEKNYSSNDLSFYKPSDMEESTINVLLDSENYVSDYARSKCCILPPESVLVTCIGIIGKVGITTKETTFNQQINAIIPNDKVCHPKYLAYAIYREKQKIKDIANAAVVPIINKRQFSNFEIALPPLDIQQKIAHILDLSSAALEKRRAQIDKLDLLVKSQFVEMFGDPGTNPKGWKRKPMGSYLSLLTDFSANGSYKHLDSNIVMFDKPEYALMIRTTDLESEDFVNDVKYISKESYELLGKSKLYGGEIIMNKIGSAGKVYYMPTLNRPASLGRNAFMFRYKEDINSVYMFYLLTSKYGENEISRHIRGAVTKTITKDAVRSLPIIIPPIDLQNQFADFVQKTKVQRDLFQESLDKLQMNHKSLIQKCFAGEVI